MAGGSPGIGFTGGAPGGVNSQPYYGPTPGNGYQNWYSPGLGGTWNGGEAIPPWQQYGSFGPVQRVQPVQRNPTPGGAPGPVSGGKGMQQPNQMNNQNMGYRHAA